MIELDKQADLKGEVLASLHKSPPVTVDALAQDLGVSLEDVRRQLVVLRDCGIRLVCHRSGDGSGEGGGRVHAVAIAPESWEQARHIAQEYWDRLFN